MPLLGNYVCWWVYLWHIVEVLHEIVIELLELRVLLGQEPLVLASLHLHFE